MNAPHRFQAPLLYTTSLLLPIALLLAIVILPQTARLDVPLHFSHDGAYTAVWVKAVIDGDPWWNVSRLAAPFHHNLYLHPVSSTVDYAVAGLFGVIFRDVGVALNLVWFLFVGLTGLAAAYAFRKFGVTWYATILASTLYALLPYTLFRQMSQLNLSLYLVPVLCMTAWLFFTGKFSVESRRTRAFLLVLVALAGLNSPYYALFTLILFVHATLVQALARKNWRSPLLAIGLLLVMVAVNLVPGYLALRSDPTAAEHLAERPVHDVNTLGFVLRELFIPVPNHPVPAFRWIAKLNDEEFHPHHTEHKGERLGIFGSFGALVLLFVMILPQTSPWQTWRGLSSRLAAPAALSLGLILVGMIGGFSNAIAILEGGTIRAYSRISVFVAVFAFLASAIVFDVVTRRITRRAVLGVFTALAIVLGVFDQKNIFFLNPPSRVQDYDEIKLFVGDIEAQLRPGAMVYIIPNQEIFEENGFRNIRLYLLSDTLRWSHAPVVMPTRATQWYTWLDDQPMADWPELLALAGFDGVALCREQATDPDDILKLFSRHPGVQISTSAFGNFDIIDISNLRRNVVDTLGAPEFQRRQNLILNRQSVDD